MRDRFVSFQGKDCLGNKFGVRMLISNPAVAARVAKATKKLAPGSLEAEAAVLQEMRCEFTDAAGELIPLDELGQDEYQAVLEGYREAIKGGSKKPTS